MHVTACGGANIDTIALLEGKPKGFEGEVKIREMRREYGGSAANFACAMSRLGMKTAFVGCVGKDEEALLVKRNFGGFGVDASQLQHDKKNPTGRVFIFVAGGEKTMLSYDGANASLSFRQINKKFLNESKLIHVSKTRMDFAYDAASYAKKKAIPFSFDPGRMVELGFQKLKPVLEKTDFFFPNAREVFQITRKGTREGTRVISEMVGICLTKIGKKGCLVGREGKVFHMKGFSVDSIDTTGAGDIFDASFLFYHLSGKDLSESAQFANASAALSTTRLGGMSCFQKGKIERFMRKGS